MHRAKGKGLTISQGEGEGHVFGRNQNSDTDQLKKYGFTTLHWQMGVEWLNKTAH